MCQWGRSAMLMVSQPRTDASRPEGAADVGVGSGLVLQVAEPPDRDCSIRCR